MFVVFAAGGAFGEDLEDRPVGHPLPQVICAGPQVAALAGQRRAHLEEEPGRDHAGLGELVADSACGGVGGHRHRHAAVRGTVEGLEQLDQEPDQRRRDGQQEQRDDSAGPRVLARRATSARRPGRSVRPLTRWRRRAVATVAAIAGDRPAQALAFQPGTVALIGRPLEAVRHRKRSLPSFCGWLASQPALQQVCGSARVLVRPPAGAFGQARREALVVQLDGHGQLPFEAGGELPRLGRLGRVSPG